MDDRGMPRHYIAALFDAVVDAHHDQRRIAFHLFTVDHDVRPDQFPVGLFKIPHDIGIFRLDEHPAALGRDFQKLLLVCLDGKVIFEIEIADIHFPFLIETHPDRRLAVGQKRFDVGNHVIDLLVGEIPRGHSGAGNTVSDGESHGHIGKPVHDFEIGKVSGLRSQTLRHEPIAASLMPMTNGTSHFFIDELSRGFRQRFGEYVDPAFGGGQSLRLNGKTQHEQQTE